MENSTYDDAYNIIRHRFDMTTTTEKNGMKAISPIRPENAISGKNPSYPFPS